MPAAHGGIALWKEEIAVIRCLSKKQAISHFAVWPENIY